MIRQPRRCALRLLNMLGRRIDQVHAMSESGEPAGIGSCSPAGIDNGGRSGREMAKN